MERQPCVQMLVELRNRLRDGRLSGLQAARGRGKRARLDDGDEHLPRLPYIFMIALPPACPVSPYQNRLHCDAPEAARKGHRSSG